MQVTQQDHERWKVHRRWTCSLSCMVHSCVITLLSRIYWIFRCKTRTLMRWTIQKATTAQMEQRIPPNGGYFSKRLHFLWYPTERETSFGCYKSKKTVSLENCRPRLLENFLLLSVRKWRWRINRESDHNLLKKRFNLLYIFTWITLTALSQAMQDILNSLNGKSLFFTALRPRR